MLKISKFFYQCPQIILNIPQRICAVDRIKELNSRMFSASRSSTDPFSCIFNYVEYKNPLEKNRAQKYITFIN